MKNKKTSLLGSVLNRQKTGNYFKLQKDYGSIDSGLLKSVFGCQRQLIEQEMQKVESDKEILKFKLGIERSSDAVFITDPEGIIKYVNASFEKVYGFSKKETIGQTPRILKSGFMNPDDYKSFWTTLLNKGIVAGEVINRTKDGSVITIDASNNPILDDSDNIIGFLSIHRDITERKKAEEELIAAKDKAQENDRLKTAFLHNISHEIRTPMNAIIGFSSLLSEPGISSSSMESYIKTIMHSSNQLLDIVTNIIEIANIEAGILNFKKDVTNLNSLIKDLYKKFSAKIIEKGIEFRYETTLPDREATIETDSNILIQVLGSLLNNAVKFTERGNISFGYSRKNDYAEFFVSDTGIGIHEVDFERIFDRFYQKEHPDSRVYEGTGLGLSISKAYIRLLGGSIWLKSTCNEGSVFYFTVPWLNFTEASTKEETDIKDKKIKLSNKKRILITEEKR
jgi:PAS domain S-box-containing protein